MEAVRLVLVERWIGVTEGELIAELVGLGDERSEGSNELALVLA
jgi:hypothetical protein